ncbi:MAG: FHA domain-containing protein [Desulfobacterales bacterium]|jgi:pSer/pThr/pTyr-binding forkhead associated (FHA) protein|nr:FHA domain-containing protein [Desulfobacterales bacterium]
MPQLILSHENDVLDTYVLDAEKTVKIGRSDQNDIVLDESAVSGFHAEIESEPDGFYITDILSKNGTFVDGELVISRKLDHGNIITIGTYALTFKYADNENHHPKTAGAVSEATMMVDTPTHRSKLAKSLAEIGEHKKKNVLQGEFLFLDGKSPPVLLEKPITTIGKDSTCDIPAKGLLVAKIAAEVVKKHDGFFIKPTVGKFFPKLNNKPLKTEVRLNDFDLIEIGSTRLQFHFRTT